MRKSLFLKIRAIVITSIISTIAFATIPAFSQETEGEGEQSVLVESTISGDIDASKAVTVEDVTIPLDELQLLLEPLIIEELQVESVAWLILLKNKVQEINNTEITIKRLKEAIEKEKEATQALEKDQTQENIQEARQLVKEAIENNQKLLKDQTLKQTVEEGENKKDITNAKKILEEAKKEQDNLTPDSPARKNIDALNQALIDLEAAEKDLEGALPGSPEAKEFSQRIEQIKPKVLKLSEDIVKSGLVQSKGKDETSVNSEESKEKLDDIASNLDKGKGTGEVINELNQLVKAQENLKTQLETNVIDLQGDKTAIIDRFNLVLDALDDKGNDTVAYRKYVDVISKIKVDISDAQDIQGVGVRLISWLKSEEGGIRWGLNAAKFLSILIVSGIISLTIGGFIERTLKKVPTISTLFRNFIVVSVERGVFVIGLLIALTSLGVSLGPLLALLGGISFVLGFALQSNLGNFASGMMLFINKPFDVGDEVKVAGYWAYVDSITLASTKLKGFDGTIITLPNNTVWGGDIINYTHADTRKLMLPINIKFSQDMNQVYEMWMEITSSNPKVLKDPAPGWFPYNSTYDTQIWVGLSAWATKDDYWGVYVELVKELQKHILELEIKLAAPIQEVKFDRPLPETIDIDAISAKNPIDGKDTKDVQST